MTSPPEDSPEPRDLALVALYEADQRRLSRAELDADYPAKAARLVRGVEDHLAELGSAIDGVSTRWRVARMPPVDRAILRLGLYELRFEKRTPIGVILAEAVRLARTYSTERSSSFVNGILSQLATRERPDELQTGAKPVSP